MSDYSYTKEIKLSYDEALNTIPGELKKEGFGVLTEIDVKETMKKKLDVDFPRYKILGACNPPFAHKALVAEANIGTLLPCNVVVYEKDGKTILSMMKPSAAMSMVESPELKKLAGEADQIIKRVFDSIK
jgi:uncharacterized protein (DUF302 family)